MLRSFILPDKFVCAYICFELSALSKNPSVLYRRLIVAIDERTLTG